MEGITIIHEHDCSVRALRIKSGDAVYTFSTMHDDDLHKFEEFLHGKDTSFRYNDSNGGFDAGRRDGRLWISICQFGTQCDYDFSYSMPDPTAGN